MATTAAGTPYVEGSDTITSYPTTSLSLANRVDSVESTASANYQPKTTPVTSQSGSAYTLALADAGKLLLMSASVSASVTIPSNTSASFATGATIGILAAGSASLSVIAASGVTINSTVGAGSPVALTALYAGVTLFKTDTNTWYAVGSIQ
jgi:hypothetical protein